jgi:SAM-dependent methyltransferase
LTRPSGDVEYACFGRGYALRRRPDPGIAALIHHALGSARTVLNVGAGAGSYEPTDRAVVAVEPAEPMIAQRTSDHSPAVRAVAGALPLADGAVDASMATVTVHQWPDPIAGLLEIRRVTAGPIVILTFDPEELDRLWIGEYAPDLIEVESRRYPTIAALTGALGPGSTVQPVAIPLHCPDGFTEAFYGRPEALLDPAVRRSQSAWSFLDRGAEERAVEALAADLGSGRWDGRHGHLRSQERFEGAARLVVNGGRSGRTGHA